MELTRLIVKGGVLSPGELREVVNMALKRGQKQSLLGQGKILFSQKNLLQFIRKKQESIILFIQMRKAETTLYLLMFRLIFSEIHLG